MSIQLHKCTAFHQRPCTKAKSVITISPSLCLLVRNIHSTQWLFRLVILWYTASMRYVNGSNRVYAANHDIQDTWFRFKIKQLVGSINTSPSEYFWIDMCFFSSWDEKANTMICFDLPDNLSSNIMAILEDRSRLNGTDTAAFLAPYSLHTIVLDVVIPLFDKSIWTLSNNIRMIEQVSLR